jgi:hypothetical protein
MDSLQDKYQEQDIVAEVSLEQAAQSRLLLSKVPSPRHWLVDMGSHEGKQKDK